MGRLKKNWTLKLERSGLLIYRIEKEGLRRFCEPTGKHRAFGALIEATQCTPQDIAMFVAKETTLAIQQKLTRFKDNLILMTAYVDNSTATKIKARLYSHEFSIPQDDEFADFFKNVPEGDDASAAEICDAINQLSKSPSSSQHQQLSRAAAIHPTLPASSEGDGGLQRRLSENNESTAAGSQNEQTRAAALHARNSTSPGDVYNQRKFFKEPRSKETNCEKGQDFAQSPPMLATNPPSARLQRSETSCSQSQLTGNLPHIREREKRKSDASASGDSAKKPQGKMKRVRLEEQESSSESELDGYEEEIENDEELVAVAPLHGDNVVDDGNDHFDFDDNAGQENCSYLTSAETKDECDSHKLKGVTVIKIGRLRIGKNVYQRDLRENQIEALKQSIRDGVLIPPNIVVNVVGCKNNLNTFDPDRDEFEFIDVLGGQHFVDACKAVVKEDKEKFKALLALPCVVYTNLPNECQAYLTSRVQSASETVCSESFLERVKRARKCHDTFGMNDDSWKDHLAAMFNLQGKKDKQLRTIIFYARRSPDTFAQFEAVVRAYEEKKTTDNHSGKKSDDPNHTPKYSLFRDTVSAVDEELDILFSRVLERKSALRNLNADFATLRRVASLKEQIADKIVVLSHSTSSERAAELVEEHVPVDKLKLFAKMKGETATEDFKKFAHEMIVLMNSNGALPEVTVAPIEKRKEVAPASTDGEDRRGFLIMASYENFTAESNLRNILSAVETKQAANRRTSLILIDLDDSNKLVSAEALVSKLISHEASKRYRGVFVVVLPKSPDTFADSFALMAKQCNLHFKDSELNIFCVWLMPVPSRDREFPSLTHIEQPSESFLAVARHFFKPSSAMCVLSDNLGRLVMMFNDSNLFAKSTIMLFSSDKVLNELNSKADTLFADKLELCTAPDCRQTTLPFQPVLMMKMEKPLNVEPNTSHAADDVSLVNANSPRLTDNECLSSGTQSSAADTSATSQDGGGTSQDSDEEDIELSAYSRNLSKDGY